MFVQVELGEEREKRAELVGGRSAGDCFAQWDVFRYQSSLLSEKENLKYRVTSWNW